MKVRILVIAALLVLPTAAVLANEPVTSESPNHPAQADRAPQVAAAEQESAIVPDRVANRDGAFPTISREQRRPLRTSPNAKCGTSCLCGRDCKITFGPNTCETAPASNCKYWTTECDDCGSCVCF